MRGERLTHLDVRDDRSGDRNEQRNSEDGTGCERATRSGVSVPLGGRPAVPVPDHVDIFQAFGVARSVVYFEEGSASLNVSSKSVFSSPLSRIGPKTSVSP